MTLKHYTSQEMPEDKYHGDELADYVSGSVLWDFFNRSPAEAVYGEPKDTAALQFGTLAHLAVLEPVLFHEQYARDFEAPEGCLTSDSSIKSWLKERGISGYSTKKGFDLVTMVHQADPDQKCFIDEQRKYQEANSGREFIKPDMYDQLTTMARTMAGYESYEHMIALGIIESSIVGYSERFGLDVKVKPDIWCGNVICNYKTTNSAKPDDIIRDCFKYGYLMKEFFNASIVAEYKGEFPKIRILAQCKNAPYIVTGIELNEEQIEIGRVQLENALALYKACKEADAYIDHSQGGFLDVETPPWMITQTVK